jgi:sodium/potassium-transporting ATPase subunit alpha
MGVAETLVATMAFFLVFSNAGVPVAYVGYHRELWTASSPTLVTDSGRTFTAAQQVEIYHAGVAAYFLTVILCQAVHVFLCKTRLSSVFTHPIFRNTTTLYGVAVAVAVAAFCIYVPVVNNFLLMTYLPVWCWTPFLVFALFAIVETETVKYCARRWPDSNAWWMRALVW